MLRLRIASMRCPVRLAVDRPPRAGIGSKYQPSTLAIDHSGRRDRFAGTPNGLRPNALTVAPNEQQNGRLTGSVLHVERGRNASTQAERRAVLVRFARARNHHT